MVATRSSARGFFISQPANRRTPSPHCTNSALECCSIHRSALPLQCRTLHSSCINCTSDKRRRSAASNQLRPRPRSARGAGARLTPRAAEARAAEEQQVAAREAEVMRHAQSAAGQLQDPVMEGCAFVGCVDKGADGEWLGCEVDDCGRWFHQFHFANLTKNRQRQIVNFCCPACGVLS